MTFADWYRLLAPRYIGVYLLPELCTELRFAPPRKWRADYAIGRVLVEIEGAVWVQGRHTRGSGFVKDMEKYNRAAELGYVVVRYTPQMIENDPDGVIRQVINTWKVLQ